MAVVFIPHQWRTLTGGVDRAEVEGQTVGQLIRALDARFPGLAARLITDEGLARGLALSIDGNYVTRGLLAKVEPTSEVHFLPAIGGG